MGSITHSIVVNAPLRVVYNQWTQFEEFPLFMEGVEEVRQEGDKRLLWKAKIAGKDKQWEAEITEQVPDKRIAWVSVDGTPNAGEVTFDLMESERTLITLTMEYEPEGFLETAGDVLGIPSGQVEENLKRFRDFIEQTGKETGGWRGRIGEGPNEIAGAIKQEAQARSVEAVNERSDREIAPGEAGIETDRIRAQQVKSFQTGEHLSPFADEHKPLVGERLVEPFETAKTPAERGESFPKQYFHDLANESTPVAADRLDEQGEQQIRPTDEQIARRAYELYLNRGQTPGHELEDWLQAEREHSETWRQ